MKKFSLVAALMVLLCGASLSAKDFDWSECWCNYGGGIEKGDFLVNVSGGLLFNDIVYMGHDDFWLFPPVMLEVQFAQPVWKLPFTFGGYAGFHGYGYKVLSHYDNHLNPVYDKKSCWAVFFGGEAAYHIQLPVETLDVYAAARVGGNIPFIRPGTLLFLDYFNIGGAIGANWYFAKAFGVNVEIGYPFAKAGVTFKF